MIEAMILETSISFLVNLISDKLFTKPEDRAHFDFVYQDENDEKTIIEVKTDKFSPRIITKLADRLKQYEDVKNFYLITPSKPDSNKLETFNKIFEDFEINCKWIGSQDFFRQYNFEINDNKDLAKLQIAGITTGIEKYNSNQIGLDFYSKRISNIHQFYNDLNEGKETLGQNRLSLIRQFPIKVIGSLPDDTDAIIEHLHIGEIYNNSIIFLSDLKNFSTIVSAVEPDILQDLMQKYYVNAKNLVFKYNGILDKFIGDAVLAIFNYPQQENKSYQDVLKFASELIIMGKELLAEMQMNIDNVIETGTRVGISTGKIYPLNVSDKEIELTFIGDKINLAARLEGKSETNGILVTNSFYHKHKKYWPEQNQLFNWIEKEFPKEDMKGQITDIRVWQIQEPSLQIVINT